MKCAFCELPEIKERQVAESECAWAFLGNMPITPGHTLVCPKRCLPRYEDLSLEEKEEVELLRQKVCTALRKAVGAEGFNFAWNDGEGCGQSEPHYHLHIIPRTKNDAGIYEYEPRQFLYRPGTRATTPEQELQDVAKLVRAEL